MNRPYKSYKQKSSGKELATRPLMTQCIFCNIIAKTAPAEILYEDEQAVVISNINPLTRCTCSSCRENYRFTKRDRRIG